MNDQAKTSPSSREENGFPHIFFQTGERRVKKDEKWGMKTKVTCVLLKLPLEKTACSPKKQHVFFCFYPPSKSKDYYFAHW